MRREEFNQLVGVLRIYPQCVTKETYDTWYDSLKRYDYGDIYEAVRRYVQESSFVPRPADIISRLPKAPTTGKFVRQFITLPDGREARLIACKQCQDTGLVISFDDEGRTVGHPCTCDAAHDKYRWGWLSCEEQQEFCNKHGFHGEEIGEVWA